jgi:ADP-ribosylglycohydrolase
MRVSPVGCAFKTLETTLEIAEQSAIVSHNHPEGIKGAKCIADLIFRTLQYNDLETKEEPYKEGFLLVPSIDYKYKVDRTPQQIIDSGYKFDSTCQGSVPEAICCFAYSGSYEETIRNAIYINGDCDTQAAIAGSIAAAYWGIPKDIADEGLERLPDDLYDVLEKFSEKYNLEL